MTYEDIITTISEIVNNEKIYKTGLTLVYELSELRHKQLDEHLFYKTNPEDTKFTHQDIIELEIGGVLVKFVRKGAKIVYENLLVN